MTRPVIIALVLAVPTLAEAQTNCRIVTEAYPAMQMSFVSKECWGVYGKTITDTLPAAVEPPPMPPEKPKCRMKGRIWHEGKCYLKRRLPKS